MNEAVEVLLDHPGGPFWKPKDEGAWSAPKGLIGAGEKALTAAQREFLEETGHSLNGEFITLGEVTQPRGARLSGSRRGLGPGHALEQHPKWNGRLDPDASSPFLKSTAAWFGLEEELLKILEGQAARAP